jgi:hypothetical protein
MNKEELLNTLNMTEDDIDAEQKRMLVRARADAGECLTEQEKADLIMDRSISVMAMLKDAGMAKNELDSQVTILAVAHAAGMNSYMAGMKTDIIMEVFLAGRKAAAGVLSRLALKTALDAMDAMAGKGEA